MRAAAERRIQRDGAAVGATPDPPVHSLGTRNRNNLHLCRSFHHIVGTENETNEPKDSRHTRRQPSTRPRRATRNHLGSQRLVSRMPVQGQAVRARSESRICWRVAFSRPTGNIPGNLPDSELADLSLTGASNAAARLDPGCVVLPRDPKRRQPRVEDPAYPQGRGGVDRPSAARSSSDNPFRSS